MVCFQVGTRDLSLFQSVQTGSGALPVFYTVSIVVCSPRIKRPRCEAPPDPTLRINRVTTQHFPVCLHDVRKSFPFVSRSSRCRMTNEAIIHRSAPVVIRFRLFTVQHSCLRWQHHGKVGNSGMQDAEGMRMCK